MQVDGHCGHPRGRKVPLPREEALPLHVGEQEAAQAIVHVQPHAFAQRQVAQLLDRVDDAVAKGGRRGVDGHDAPAEVRGDGGGSQLARRGVERQLDKLDTKVKACFHEGWVRREPRHDLRPLDAALAPRLAVGEHGEEAAAKRNACSRHRNGEGHCDAWERRTSTRCRRR